MDTNAAASESRFRKLEAFSRVFRAVACEPRICSAGRQRSTSSFFTFSPLNFASSFHVPNRDLGFSPRVHTKSRVLELICSLSLESSHVEEAFSPTSVRSEFTCSFIKLEAEVFILRKSPGNTFSIPCAALCVVSLQGTLR